MLNRRIFNRAVKQTLSAELKDDNIADLLNRVWDIYRGISDSADKGKSRVVDMILDSARKNIALYKALLEIEVPDEIAKKHAEKINWELNKKMGTFIYFLSTVIWRPPTRRVKWINNMLWKYVFTKPFERVLVESAADVAFNITRCPIQEYYRVQNVLELCEYTSCNMDPLLAKAWRSRFQRDQTLAKGDAYCDFRFYVNNR
jgi:L-2-amino-thiazoline-4-carboxylic acid hydrolase